MAKKRGQFKKGGGHVGHKTKTRYRTKTKIKYRTRKEGGKHRRRGRHRRHHGSGGVSLMKLGIAGLGLGLLTGDSAPIATVKTYAEKIPGAKTFGSAATLGMPGLATTLPV